MALEDYLSDAKRCCRCSYCKWIPLAQVKSWRFAKGCPSIAYKNFHSYSAGGRLAVVLSLSEGRSSYTDGLLDVVYQCQMDGSCDVACKICRYHMEPLEAMRELRFKLVEEGQLLPQHIPVIDNLVTIIVYEDVGYIVKLYHGTYGRGRLILKEVIDDDIFYSSGSRDQTVEIKISSNICDKARF